MLEPERKAMVSMLEKVRVGEVDGRSGVSNEKR